VGGLCFGHQLIAKALGGEVGPSPAGWRVGVAPTRFWQPQPWMQPPQAETLWHAVHQEQVLKPPPGVTVIGGDEHAPVGALAAGRHLFTSQYHPELPTAFMADLLEHLGEHFPPDTVARARDDIERPEPTRDASIFFRWLAQWIEGSRAGAPGR
jgi:GMP synthase-like glutamine amidotransferase